MSDNTRTAIAGPPDSADAGTRTQNEWQRPRPPVCSLTTENRPGQTLANHDTEPPTAGDDVPDTSDACQLDTMSPHQKRANGANIGQGRGPEYNHLGNDPLVANNIYTGELNCATPLKVNTRKEGYVSTSPGGHATSTPSQSYAKIVSHMRMQDMQRMLNSSPIRRDGSSIELDDLNETVDEVVDVSTQNTLRSNDRCGPTPDQYRSFVAANWPLVSGEKWSDYPVYTEIYDRVRHTALPNFLAARVAIPSGLKIDCWRQELKEYHDPTLVEQLEFGFPSNYSIQSIPTPCFTNHRESPEYASHVKEYIEKECRLGALLGPFKVPPFSPWSHCSPLMTRPKSTAGKRRIIVDLSYPRGKSVNTGIPRREFLGKVQTYTLPTVSMVGDRLRTLGTNSHIWSADISRAYRQLRADPLAVPLYGITYEDRLYVDIALPFGCRSSGASCVRVTSAILWILHKMGYNGLAYVDDFIGVEESFLQAQKAFDAFINLCNRLGIMLATDKCHPPSLQLIWLGFYIDARAMTIAIPVDKLDAVIKDAEKWLHRPRASKKALQQLVGRLVHICSCVQHGRRFITRILKALSDAHYFPQVEVTDDLIRDIKWFSRYARESNGVNLIPPSVQPVCIMECDSCMTGGGAYSSKKYYAEQYTREFTTRFKAIHALEAVNLVEAVATLRPDDCQGFEIRINTDNQASASALQTGRCSDADLGLCSRELWLMAAINNFTLQVSHKPGVELVLADALSRAHISSAASRIAAERCAELNLMRVRVTHSEERFSPIL